MNGQLEFESYKSAVSSLCHRSLFHKVGFPRRGIVTFVLLRRWVPSIRLFLLRIATK